MIAAPPGDRVEQALDDARRDFLREVEERRLRLFRGCVQAAVRSASLPALSFAEHLGVGLDEVLRAMTPPAFFPQTYGPLALPRIRWEAPARHSWRGGGVDRMMWRLVRSGGHVRRVDGGGDWVGWRISGDTVEVAAALGPATLVTNRGMLRLWIPHRLPTTVCAAIPGRPLAALFHHPFLMDEGLTVVSIGDHGGGGHLLRVRVGRRRYAAPWPGQLAGLMVTRIDPSLASRFLWGE